MTNTLKRYALGTAAAALAMGATTALNAQDRFDADSFDNLAQVFQAADMDGSDSLSRGEFRALRNGTIDAAWVGAYRSDMMFDMALAIDRNFAALDRDNNGRISLTEFMNEANDPMASEQQDRMAGYWSNPTTLYDPEYLTLTYYFQTNPVDTDELEGMAIENLEGERVGRLERIVRDEQTNRNYAMIDLQGGEFYRQYSTERDTAGVPLGDLLFETRDDALLLSSRGEEYLRDAEARKIDFSDYEVVDTLYVS